MAAASVARRRSADLEIVAVEAGRHTSYSACGIPYLVGGAVERLDDLVARSPEQFRAMRIDVRTEHRVDAVDLDARTATVTNLTHGRTYTLGFDLLHLATGGVPRRPDVPGIDSPHVHGVQTLGDAERLLADAPGRPGPVVVVGGSYVGLELAEAFTVRGCEVTLVDHAPEVMHGLDPDMGALVARALRATGVTVRSGEALTGVGDGTVTTTGGELPADLVVLGIGVAPNVGLAEAAGIALGPTGAIAVDRRQRTSAEGVFAAGDCCESRHLVSGLPVHQALGTVANKQGRVVGINVSGGYATFPGVVGTAVSRLCGTEVGRTGLGEHDAEAAGFEVVAVTAQGTTASRYLHTTAEPITVKLVAEAGTGRLLGAQAVGGRGAGKRVDVAAVAITGGLDAEALLMADLGYAPPLSTTWDPLQAAARLVVDRL